MTVLQQAFSRGVYDAFTKFALEAPTAVDSLMANVENGKDVPPEGGNEAPPEGMPPEGESAPEEGPGNASPMDTEALMAALQGQGMPPGAEPETAPEEAPDGGKTPPPEEDHEALLAALQQAQAPQG